MAKHYYISFNEVDFSEIFPVGSPITNAQQWEGTRVWREELEQIKIVRVNNVTVFDTLESYFTDKTKFDTELEIEVWSGIRSTGELYFKGLFSISDSSLDPELKTFEIKPRVNDDYFDIAEKYDVQYEIDKDVEILNQERIGYAERVTLSTNWTGSTYTVLNANAGSILTAQTPTGGAEAFNSLPLVISTGDVIVVEVLSKSNALEFFFDIVETLPSVVSKTAEGVKGTTGQATLAFTATASMGSGVGHLEMSSIPSGTTAMELDVRIIRTENDHDNESQTIMGFLDEFVSGSDYMNLTGFAGNVVSTFFDNDALPADAPSTIAAYIASFPTGNYANLSRPNDLNDTMLGLLRRWFTESVEKSFKMSFKEITDQLRDIFQVYWFIDSEGKLRFEHERYFVRWVADSTAISVPLPAEVDKHLLKYEKGLIASVEQFAWPQAENVDFIGKDIIYNNFETTNNTVKYTISQFTTDINYIIENEDDASDTGLGLFNCNILTGISGADLYEIVIATGILSSSAFPNVLFGWANLHDSWWKHSRMSEDATMNGTAVTMASNIRFLQQDGVRFHYSTAIAPYTQIDTDLTGGAPIQIRRDLDTDTVEIVISYDPYKL